MTRFDRAAAWVAGLMAFAASAAVCTAASAEEYKLVLTPESGQAPPARVCLVSRNQLMKADRATGIVASLAERVACTDQACMARRDTRPARCQLCPETPHPGCRAAVDLGERTPDDYSVVCADDDTLPVEGGTVYISVESVEAENPPRVYNFEVSGGRVRWSPVEPISKPSYRVLGGDFESSRFSYPRGATDQPWAEVPLRRRCRCLDAQVGRGVGATTAVMVDQVPACRGDASPTGLLPVEVPAVEVDRVASLFVAGERGDGGTRWSSRWPTVPIMLVPRRFDFEWLMPCIWPRADICPVATIQGAACSVGPPEDGVCAYSCDVIADQAVAPPLPLHLHIDDPAIDISEILGAVGQRIVGRIPASERVVWSDISTWNHRVPGDRIRAIEVVGVDGARLTLELDAIEGMRITLPVPGARCGASVRTDYIGERDYDAGFGRVTRGGHIVLPEPAELGVPWALVLGLGGGAVVVVAQADGETTTASVSYALIGTTGIRLRPPQSSWYIEPQLMTMIIGGWSYSPLTVDGGGSVIERHSYWALAGELVLGRTIDFAGRTLNLKAGAGVGVSFDPFGDATELVEQGRTMGTWSLGLGTPVSNATDSPLGLRFEMRHWFGSRSLHYTRDDFIGIVRRAEPADALMFNVLLTFAP